jgi:hypothetical protein
LDPVNGIALLDTGATTDVEVVGSTLPIESGDTVGGVVVPSGETVATGTLDDDELDDELGDDELEDDELDELSGTELVVEDDEVGSVLDDELEDDELEDDVGSELEDDELEDDVGSELEDDELEDDELEEELDDDELEDVGWSLPTQNKT